MDANIAIRVENLTKTYKLYDTPLDRLRETFHPNRKLYHHLFHALNNVDFEVKKGETIGVIGRNGSGKSTLLKTIAGVLTPTSGKVTVNGKVSALLELGAGFNPEMTGLANVYFSGTLMGYAREEMDEKIDEILSFADIGEFVHQPVKTYSSGMFVRLAFSVATAVDPEILIVDEALSVGDAFFQAKCMHRIKSMLENGTTLFFVSHDIGAVKSLCRKSILLDNGQMISIDDTENIAEKYFSLKVKSEQAVVDVMESKDIANASDDLIGKSRHLAFVNNEVFLKRASFQRIQNNNASFINVQLLDEKGNEVSSVPYEQRLILRMAIEIYEDLPEVGFGYHLRDRNGVDVVYSDSIIEKKKLCDLKQGDRYVVDWHFKAELLQGNYVIACVMSVPLDIQMGKVDFCDFVPLACQFQMEQRKESSLYGYVHWSNTVEIQKV